MPRDLADAIPALKFKTHKLRLRDLEGGGLLTTGDIFYVDSVTGASTNPGDRPDKPMATINQALDLTGVRATKGDIIVVLPGHAEDISAATSMVYDDAGVRVIGFGVERSRPVLTYTATAGTIEMDSTNCTLENVVLFSSISAVVVGINVDAAGCQILNCEFNWDATGDDFARMVDAAGVARTKVLGNDFIAEDTAGTNEGVFLNNTDDIRIEGNYFYGDFTEGPIDSESAASTNVKIIGNSIYNSDVTAGIVLDLTQADTGIVADNHGVSLATGATIADSAIFNPGSCMDGGGNTLARGLDAKAYRVPVAGNGSMFEWRLARVADSAFDGATSNAHGNDAGTDDPHTVFTVLGDVLINAIWGICNTSLTGGTATISVGVTGNTAGLLALETATEILDGNVYVSATQAVGVAAVASSGAPVALNDGFDILEYTATANVTAGQIDYYAMWAPCEDGASIR